MALDFTKFNSQAESNNKVGVFENLGTSTVSGTTVSVNLNTGNFFQMDLDGLSGNVATFTISYATQEDGMVSCFIVKIKWSNFFYDG